MKLDEYEAEAKWRTNVAVGFSITAVVAAVAFISILTVRENRLESERKATYFEAYGEIEAIKRVVSSNSWLFGSKHEKIRIVIDGTEYEIALPLNDVEGLEKGAHVEVAGYEGIVDTVTFVQ